jgi:hypothetical protein
MPQRKRAKASTRAPRRKTAKASTRSKAKTKRPAAARPPSDPRFVADVIVRGEAASIAPGGKLPAGATHVITGGAADTATIKRARFKSY